MQFNIIFFNITSFFYLISAIFFIRFCFNKNDDYLIYHKHWMMVAVLSGTFFLLMRYREGGHLPLATLFEITFFYAWMTMLVYCFFVKSEIPRFVSAIILIIVGMFLAWQLTMDKTIYPLNPLLDSPWLVIHVPTAILGYSAFLISFAISIYYLIAERLNWPMGEIVDLNSKLILVGCVLLGICIATGSVWAKTAWGNYWSWDPKETWALITFLIYGGAAVARKAFKLNPKWQAVISIFGFIGMLITFFGVSIFMASHHAYQ